MNHSSTQFKSHGMVTAYFAGLCCYFFLSFSLLSLIRQTCESKNTFDGMITSTFYLFIYLLFITRADQHTK